MKNEMQLFLKKLASKITTKKQQDNNLISLEDYNIYLNFFNDYFSGYLSLIQLL